MSADIGDDTGAVESPPAAVEPVLWRNRDYLLLIGGQVASMAGSQVSAIAVPLMCLAITGSAAQTALVSTLGALPYLLFGLSAGVLVDRWNRRFTMIVCDVVRAVAMLALPAAYLWGGLSVALFGIVSFAAGTAFVFFNIAEQSSLVQVVGKSQLTRATAVNEVSESTASLVGPGVAGVLISAGRTQLVGGAIAVLVDGVSFVISAFSLLFIRTPLRSAQDRAARSSMWAELKQGQRYVWTHPNIRTVMLLSAALNALFSPTYLAMIVHVQQDMKAGATAVGLVFSIGAAGGLVGGLISPWVAGRVRRGHLMVAALVAWALVMPIVAVSRAPWVLILGWGLVTFISPLFDVPQVAYQLSIVPEYLQGRVNSSFRVVAWGIRPAAIGLGGVFITALGAQDFLWCVAGGMALVALAGLASDVRKVT
jgi:MFS family permease